MWKKFKEKMRWIVEFLSALIVTLALSVIGMAVLVRVGKPVLFFRLSKKLSSAASKRLTSLGNLLMMDHKGARLAFYLADKLNPDKHNPQQDEALKSRW